MRKICSRCGVEKDQQDFYKYKGRAHGVCKACRKETYQKKVEALEPIDFTGDLTCAVCGKTKPADQFVRNRLSPNGRTARCKECANSYAAEYHRARHVPAPSLPAILPTYSGSTKACGRCKELKPVSDFGADISRPSGLASYCRECSRSLSREPKVLTKGTSSRQKRVNTFPPRERRAEEWERRSARHQVHAAKQARLGAENLFKKLEQRMFAPEREQDERDRREEQERRRAVKVFAKEAERLEKHRLWEAGAEERKRKDRESRNRRNQRDNRRRRQSVLDGYGSKCACCGETEQNLLSLDHIHGGGRKDRQQRTNQKIYRDIIRRDFPKDEFQILCYNCNMAKGIYGICPHKLDIYRKPWIAASLPRGGAA